MAKTENWSSIMYDLIGDIHGYADPLVRLLKKMGYEERGGVYAHPNRKVIFLGDFVDRGPQIRQVLDIVRRMVEAKSAMAVMGNHELNALAFHTLHPNRPGENLRKRSNKNIRQHAQTIVQLGDEDVESALDWFRTLPLFLDLPELRVVHACWDDELVRVVAAAVKNYGGITTDFLTVAHTKGSELFHAVDAILKGKEIPLPGGAEMKDKEGHPRKEIRTRWYLPTENKTYRQYAFQTDELDLDRPLEQSVIASAKPYPADATPVFVGHYWLSAEKPEILADNVACLDYSVAKDGFLCAYRWAGEKRLTNANFVW